LQSAGCKKIFAEKKSGTKHKDRTQLEACLDYLREGDTLMITRIDRLSRSLRDLQNLVHELEEKGIYTHVARSNVKGIKSPIDTLN
jgi:DNA invertase Pin-like site-specific DNA recombinase